MLLDLHKIIEVPGGKVSFTCEPDLADLDFDGIEGFYEPLKAVGQVVNRAGALILTAELTAGLDCVCARCLKRFRREYSLNTEAVLSAEEPENEDTDMYLLDGDCIDTDEVILTAFVLSLDQRQLCSDACKGLCPRCGKNLNDGPCACKAESDPRLAVLGQLLEE